MNRTPYKSPVLPSPDDLAKSTERYAQHNAAIRARHAAAAHVDVVTSSSRLSEEQEIVRAEIVAQVGHIRAQLDAAQGDDYRRIAEYYAQLGEVVREFCESLAARGAAKRDALAAMREAIASLDRYRGAGR